MDKLKYTICFIKRGDEILLLNREKPSWMGSWNGVGGKFEEGETPKDCILREVYEETGIKLKDVQFKGVVTWRVDKIRNGGMYLFMQEVSEDFEYKVPIKTREGILDWKKVEWIMNPENTGIAHNLPKFLPKMLKDKGTFQYHCIFNNNVLLDVEIKKYDIKENIAVNLLLKKLLLNVDMLQCIRRDSAEIIFASDKGVLLYDAISRAYMMSTEDMKTAKEIISKIPQNANIVVCHQEVYYDLLMSTYHFKDKMICNNSVYTKNTLMEVSKASPEIRLLTRDYIGFIIKHYSKKELCNDDYIGERIDAGVVYGAFIDGELCGFIGSHEEGSIGMLEVLPQFRRRKIATHLIVKAVNEMLKKGFYAYGQIEDGNEASTKLQKKLGFQISKEKICWLFKL
ncbi:GNAT family N-acetyltransferase [Clostridium sp. DMHC 10]|uniref:GNAT family N-acetyltransferase n=1 Tax=Clostridium sp. DMHC 10 TaxID=747377 RepID=UPI000A035A50|nr:GNAT family N-acetyltransferase [Clostridium sp. DMHC 10]